MCYIIGSLQDEVLLSENWQ